MRVLAIDPGFGRCGVAVLEGEGSTATLLYSNCIETQPNSNFSLRLLEVAKTVLSLIDTYLPDTIAIEELYFSSNQKTVFHVAEVRGMLMYLAVSHGVTLVEYNPLTVKTALTGYGRATKQQITKMVATILKLETKARKDDEYDAIALGITAIAHARRAASENAI